MSWLECKSKTRFNRLGYLVRNDKTREPFRFRYVGESGLSSPEIMPNVETICQTITIDTPSKLDFSLSSLLSIGGPLFTVSSVQELEGDSNGPFRGKGVIVKRITASKLI